MLYIDFFLHQNHYQKETIYDKLVFFLFFAKLVLKKWAQFELECLLLTFTYTNLKCVVIL